MQEQDVRYHVRTGVGFERIVGKTNGPQQVGALGNVPSGAVVFAVHRIPRGHKRDDTARTHLIERLGEKVIVNRKTELVVSPVIYLILSEWHIADGKVIEIASICCLKARNRNVGFGIKLLCNAPGDAVQLDAIELTALHGFR